MGLTETVKDLSATVQELVDQAKGMEELPLFNENGTDTFKEDDLFLCRIDETGGVVAVKYKDLIRDISSSGQSFQGYNETGSMEFEDLAIVIGDRLNSLKSLISIGNDGVNIKTDSFTIDNHTYKLAFKTDLLSSDREVLFQDKSGTVAFLSDIVNEPSGVQSVTGDGVSGTPEDVVMTFPTPLEINAEEDLGLPSANGMVLSSTELGVRSWVNLPAPPDINLQAFFEQYRKVWTGGSQVFQMQSAVKFMFGVYVNGVRLDETQLDRNDEYGSFEILDTLDVNDIVIAVYQEDENVLLPYAPTTSLNLRIATTSGQGYSVDWGDGVWVDYASSQTVDRPKTFGSATSGVARIKAVNGLSDFRYLRSAIGTWDFTNVSKLASLTYLELFSNSFTGDMSGVSALTSLTHLNLVGNSFTGDMSGVANLTSLPSLNLNGDLFTGDMSGVVNLASMTYLQLIGNFTINYTSKIWSSNMQSFLFRPTTTANPLGTSELDQLLQDLSTTTWAMSKIIFADGNNGVRSSASNAAVATLQGMGVTLGLNT